jgi:hypothetical protein
MFELRQAVLSRNFNVASKFLSLLDKMQVRDVRIWLYRGMLRFARPFF